MHRDMKSSAFESKPFHWNWHSDAELFMYLWKVRRLDLGLTRQVRMSSLSLLAIKIVIHYSFQFCFHRNRSYWPDISILVNSHQILQIKSHYWKSNPWLLKVIVSRVRASFYRHKGPTIWLCWGVWVIWFAFFFPLKPLVTEFSFPWHTEPLNVGYFLARVFFTSKSICMIFFSEITHTRPHKSNGPSLSWFDISIN